MPIEERLQKVLAHAGVASRRKCEKLIRQGCMRVNGQMVAELGAGVELGDLPAGKWRYLTPEGIRRLVSR